MESQDDTDNFEIGLRFMGQEVVGLRLASRSKMRNWIVVSMMCMIVLTIVFVESAPTVTQIMKDWSK
jgi:hypothetical protein